MPILMGTTTSKVPVSPSLCAPHASADHVTQLPHAVICQGLIAKREVKIKNQLSRLTAFPYCPPRVSPGSPAGVTYLSPFLQAQPAQMLVWSRTFLPPYPFPQWAMCFPRSLTFAMTARCPLLFGCSRFRRAQTTEGQKTHPFVGQR